MGIIKQCDNSESGTKSEVFALCSKLMRLI